MYYIHCQTTGSIYVFHFQCIVLMSLSPEAEFMNLNFVEVSGHKLESSQNEVSVRISEAIGQGFWFSIRFSSFLLYSVQVQ